MSITEYIISAFRCLSASKMRTFLTTLGIIVGISSVILINTIGGTIGSTIASSFNSLVSGNIIELMIVDKDTDTESVSSLLTIKLADTEFDKEAVAEYESLMADCLSEYTFGHPTGGGWLRTPDNNKAFVSVSPIDIQAQSANGIIASEGRCLNEEDELNAVPAVVITNISAEHLFGNSSDAIGKQITLNDTGSLLDGRELIVVGVYDDPYEAMNKAYGEDTDADGYQTTAYVTNEYFDSICGKQEKTYQYLAYFLDKDTDIDEFKDFTEDYFAPYFEGTDYKLFIFTLSDELDIINSVIDFITKIIAAIAAISLLVGGIGVMNIMLVSVSERTMEIGVRKAMGADNKSIRIQFIVESVIISLIGSAIGIIVGLVEAKLLAIIVSAISDDVTANLSVPLSAVLYSVAFSFAVGLLFGVYPANKAAKMQVVDALRYE